MFDGRYGKGQEPPIRYNRIAEKRKFMIDIFYNKPFTFPLILIGKNTEYGQKNIHGHWSFAVE
jgi:hypothetical protein